MFQAGDPLLKLWRTRGLNRLFNATVPFTPPPVRRWIERTRAEVRTKDTQDLINQRSRLVPEQEFRRVLANGIHALTTGPEPLGDYLEFGVYNGTSLTCVFRELQAFARSLSGPGECAASARAGRVALRVAA